MLMAQLCRRYLRGIVPVGLTMVALMSGCVPPEVPQSSPPPADAGKRLAALEECVVRAQWTVHAAVEAGVSTASLASTNSSIADAQDAADEVRKLIQENQPHAAIDRATKGLEECDKVDAMVTKARQDTAERKMRAQLTAEAETRLTQTAACVDGARQAVRSAGTIKTRSADATAARGALDSAEAALKQARELLVQNDPKGALGRLDAAQADCQTAQASGGKAAAPGREASPAAPPRRSW